MLQEDFEREALERVKKHEGFNSLPYRDPLKPNILTVGYGHNLMVPMRPGLAEKILLDDWEVHENELNKVFTMNTLNRIPFHKYYMLVELMFQLGLSSFRSFKRMNAAIQRGDMNEAAKELRDSNYYRQVTGRAEELAKILES